MWTWYQTGTMDGPSGQKFTGYSGLGPYKNSPSAQDLENLGPIPCGVYRIGDPYDSATHGPFVLPLTPDSANKMFGRAAFLIHGDSVHAPGTASKGCIVLPRANREAIYASKDRMLCVEARPPEPVAMDPGMEAE